SPRWATIHAARPTPPRRAGPCRSPTASRSERCSSFFRGQRRLRHLLRQRSIWTPGKLSPQCPRKKLTVKIEKVRVKGGMAKVRAFLRPESPSPRKMFRSGFQSLFFSRELERRFTRPHGWACHKG